MCQYEATSMATFKHGRTETIRPATNEVAAAVDIYKQVINNPDDILLKDEFRKKLKLAMSAHNKVMRKKFRFKIIIDISRVLNSKLLLVNLNYWPYISFKYSDISFRLI